MERLGDDADGQDALVAGSLRNDRSSTGTGTTTHACGHEAHVGAVEMIDDLVEAFFSGSAADFRLRAGAETFGDLHTHLDDTLGLGHGQRLGIGIGNDEIDAFEPGSDHVVDSVTATATHAENSDPRLQLGDVRLVQLDRHCTFSFCFWSRRRADQFFSNLL
ncbi:hypothetical protein D3C80_820600 [compost metagenome]